MIWKDVLLQPGARDHLVQFYGSEQDLAENVAAYLKAGALRGDNLLLVATPSHAALFVELLQKGNVDVELLRRQGRLVVREAAQMLSELLAEGEPTWPRFDQVIGGLVRDMKGRSGSAGLLAYGEMVDLLWKDGKLAAATQLETFWNRLLETERFGLFCAYTVDILDPGTRGHALQEVVATHSHLLPVRTNGELLTAVRRAMNDVLGGKAVDALMPLIQANVIWKVALPTAERVVLWLRRNLPSYVDEVLARARIHYEEECARTGGTRVG